MDKLTFGETMDAVIADQEAHGRHTVKHTRMHVKALGERFAGRRAISITRAEIDQYVSDRLKAGLSRGSIARELSQLRHGFRLAVARGLLSHAPAVPHFKAGVRKGFVNADQYRTLHAKLPDPLHDMLTVGYAIGWRLGELLTLTWDRVDLERGVLRLEAGETKTDEPREVYLSAFPQLLEVFRRRSVDAKALGIPWVFWRATGPRRGRPFSRTAVERTWKDAAHRAGVPILFHDLRRSAVRNLEAAGVPRSVAMKITGHKSETVYRRYAITTPEDTKQALGKVAALIGYAVGMAETVKAALAGTETGTPPRQARLTPPQSRQVTPPRFAPQSINA